MLVKMDVALRVWAAHVGSPAWHRSKSRTGRCTGSCSGFLVPGFGDPALVMALWEGTEPLCAEVPPELEMEGLGDTLRW